MTISLDEFSSDAAVFLAANAELRKTDESGWGEGDDSVALLPERTPEEDLAVLEAARQWRIKAFDAGFGWITGPQEYGGRALGRDYQNAFDRLASKYDLPSQEPYGIGLGMVAPTILAHATQEVKSAYLKKMWRGDIVGCQLFSEPEAGSDLASLQTRAVKDGDEWVLNGQKVWTSNAQYADIGEIVTRTDPEAPKHKGITAFVVDMHAPGVEVRPLRQMTGGASFNEVFFNDVRVPDSHRLGDINGGWSVAITTLMNERMAIGGNSPGSGSSGAGSRLFQLAKISGASDSPLIRNELADLYINLAVSRYTSRRAAASLKAGKLPGPEMSVGKLALTNNLQRISAIVGKMLGAKVTADTGEWGTFAWSTLMLGVPGMRVAGGTDEVMRNILGERVLGLPKDPIPKAYTSAST